MISYKKNQDQKLKKLHRKVKKYLRQFFVQLQKIDLFNDADLFQKTLYDMFSFICNSDKASHSYRSTLEFFAAILDKQIYVRKEQRDAFNSLDFDSKTYKKIYEECEAAFIFSKLQKEAEKLRLHEAETSDTVSTDGSKQLSILRWATGAGKTSTIIKKAIADYTNHDKKVVVIVGSANLAKSMAKILHIPNYEDIKLGKCKTEDVNAFVTCLPSLKHEKIKALMEDMDVVIFDEARADIKALNSDLGVIKDSEKLKTRSDLLEQLKKDIARKHVIISDAFLEDSDVIAFLKLMEGSVDTGRIEFISEKLARKPEKKKQLYYIQKDITKIGTAYNSNTFKESFLRFLEREIFKSEGLPVVVAVSTPKTAKSIANSISHLSLPHLLVNSTTSSLEMQQRFIKDPNGEINKYRVIIHTPSIHSGISITEPVQSVLFYNEGGHLGHDDVLQMMNRSRNAKRFFYFDSNMIKPQEKVYQKRFGGKVLNELDCLIKFTKDESKKKSLKEYRDWFELVEEDRAIKRAKFGEFFRKAAIKDNFQIKLIKDLHNNETSRIWGNKGVKAMMEHFKAWEEADRYDLISSPDINSQEAIQGKCTEYSFQKHKIQANLGVSIDKDGNEINNTEKLRIVMENEKRIIENPLLLAYAVATSSVKIDIEELKQRHSRFEEAVDFIKDLLDRLGLKDLTILSSHDIGRDFLKELNTDKKFAFDCRSFELLKGDMGEHFLKKRSERGRPLQFFTDSLRRALGFEYRKTQNKDIKSGMLNINVLKDTSKDIVNAALTSICKQRKDLAKQGKEFSHIKPCSIGEKKKNEPYQNQRIHKVNFGINTNVIVHFIAAGKFHDIEKAKKKYKGKNIWHNMGDYSYLIDNNTNVRFKDGQPSSFEKEYCKIPPSKVVIECRTEKATQELTEMLGGSIEDNCIQKIDSTCFYAFSVLKSKSFKGNLEIKGTITYVGNDAIPLPDKPKEISNMKKALATQKFSKVPDHVLEKITFAEPYWIERNCTS